MVEAPREVILGRNAARARRVPDDVIDKHLDQLAVAREHLYEEGFALIETVDVGGVAPT